MSVLDNLLKSLPEGSRFQPKQLNDDAVSQPQAHNFVRPPLQIEQLYQNNQPIVIISAPGAVGKSALARFICGEKKSFLIDLSKLRLGSHTFRGTISNFFGDDNYSSIMSDLKNGKILFVLDAFDEAEIISGSKGIEIFLEELFGLVKDAPNTCLIFLARTSTADFMNLYLDYFASEQGLKLIHSVYSIDYFLENQAIEFIEKQVSQLKKDDDSVYHTTKHSKTFKDALNEIFTLFYNTLDEKVEKSKEWNNDYVRSFLGYAPVLQTIALYLSDRDNYQITLNEIRKNHYMGANLICELMNRLLYREQDKLVKKLQQEHINKNWDGWDSLYTPIEQLQRLFLYLNRKEYMEIHDDEIPSWLVDDYKNAIDNFLRQHPFVRERKFTGPAFRDYTFARLLAEKVDYTDVKDAWHNSSDDSVNILSPLFAQIYANLSKGITYGDIVGYIYESATSGGVFSNQLRLDIAPKDDKGELHSLYFLRTLDQQDKLYEMELDVIINDAHPLMFPRKLKRANIQINSNIILGSSNNIFEITDSEIMAEKIVIKSTQIMIRNYQPDEFVNIRAKTCESIENLRIDCDDKAKVTINWHNGKRYPWSDYFVLEEADTENYKDAMLALKRILRFFRKHKKDNSARYIELIDNVVVGNSTIRKRVQEYLIKEKILTRDSSLYYLNSEKLNINWDDLRRGQLSGEAKEFIRGFSIWNQS